MSIVGTDISAGYASIPQPVWGVAGSCRSRRVLPKTACTLLWILLLLACGEVGLRIRAALRPRPVLPPKQPSLFQQDDRFGVRLCPDTTRDSDGHRVSINRWGFRGPDVPRTKPPGTFRMVAVGDSTCFGWQASCNEATWVEQLADRMNERHTGVRFDILNGGMPQWDVATSRMLLETDMSSFDPDMVIVLHLANNLAAHTRRQFGAPRHARKSITNRLSDLAPEYSLLLRLIKLNTAALRPSSPAGASASAHPSAERRHDAVDNDGIERFARDYGRLLDYCHDNGWRTVVCTAPRVFGDPASAEDPYTLAASSLSHNPRLSYTGLCDAYERYNDAIRTTARQHGALLVDLAELVPKQKALFADAVHLSDAGHRFVGKLLADAIAVDLAERFAHGAKK